MLWHVSLLLLSSTIWMYTWHSKEIPPQHDFFSCTTPAKYCKPCPVMTTWLSLLKRPRNLSLLRSKVYPLALTYIALLLLSTSCDVELNPGPDHDTTQDSFYPCGICQEEVTWEQNSTCCDTCQIWNHKDCLSMSTTMFNNLANSDSSWICPNCENPNFTSVLFNTPITSSNDSHYSLMSDSMKSINISNITTPTSTNVNLSDAFDSQTEDYSPGSPQAASSPQVTTTPTRLRTAIKDNLKVAILNCNSIVNKVPEFQTFLADTDPDVVLGTESWLKPEIANSEIFPPEYNVFRRDRQSDVKKTGGGIFILTRRNYTCCEIPITTNCEFQAIELQLIDQQNVKICNFYRPPWTDDNYMQEFTEILQKVDAKGKGKGKGYRRFS